MKTKLLKRILPLAFALALPLCAQADDSRRWVEDITKLKTLPPADTERLDAGFSRSSISHSGDVASAALAWAEADILCGGIPELSAGDLSLFVMQQDMHSWMVSISHGAGTSVLTLDMNGRLLAYGSREDSAAAYEGVLPEGTDAAVLSYVEHFARMNGCKAVTGYERLNVRWDGTGYDVLVTAAAQLDGTRCTFTLALDTMSFTKIDCPLPAVMLTVPEAQRLIMTTPVPHAYEDFRVALGGGNITVQATDRRTRGDAFSQWPGNALPREEVFAIALQALTDAFGLSLEDLTAEPFLYGYNAESDMKYWQLDFACQSSPMEGTEYTVYVRDSDGAVLGVWGPEEANG